MDGKPEHPHAAWAPDARPCTTSAWVNGLMPRSIPGAERYGATQTYRPLLNVIPNARLPRWPHVCRAQTRGSRRCGARQAMLCVGGGASLPAFPRKHCNDLQSKAGAASGPASGRTHHRQFHRPYVDRHQPKLGRRRLDTSSSPHIHHPFRSRGGHYGRPTESTALQFRNSPLQKGGTIPS